MSDSKKINIQLLGDRIFATPKEVESKNYHFIIPETSKEKPTIGEVKYIGDGKLGEDGKLANISVKVGDTILFQKWSGNEIKINDETFICLKNSDIIAILN